MGKEIKLWNNDGVEWIQKVKFKVEGKVEHNGWVVKALDLRCNISVALDLLCTNYCLKNIFKSSFTKLFINMAHRSQFGHNTFFC